MNIPYHTIPFSLSEAGLQWLKEKTAPIVDNYQRNAPLHAALIEFPREDMQEWYDSDVWQEILAQLAPFGLQSDPVIQFFIYKRIDSPKADPRGNPHIDTLRGIESLVPIRFNILLEGEENQEMVWWDIRNYMTDDRLHVVEFPRPNSPPGTMSKRIQARGERMEDRWETVGEPDYRCTTLTKFNQCASFVRTDTLHAINWDEKNPRLIMSVRFQEPWQVLERHINNS